MRQWQDLFYEERYSSTAMTNPNFVKFAESFHCEGLKCTTKSVSQRRLPCYLAEPPTIRHVPPP
eukprot:SAG11_NODE_408_length_9704_cov_6.496774_13_plen_64_part_00